jgi:hypothetical protein
VALTATVAWYRARAREPRKGRGAAVARALGVFALDNLLIGLAVLAVRSLVAWVPALSVVEIGIAIAAGLYWLPLARRASIALVRRIPPRPLPVATIAGPEIEKFATLMGPAKRTEWA